MSLYDDHKERWDEIALETPNVAAMARHFTRHQDMCDALLFDRSTVNHWITGRSRVSAGSERRAEMWLKNGLAAKRPASEAPPPASLPSGDLFLVSAPAGVETKVRKLLEMLGCEVVEM